PCCVIRDGRVFQSRRRRLRPRLIETETNMTTFADLVPSLAGRFDGIERPYSPEDVLRLRGSVPVTHTLAERGANRLWELLHSEPYINALGAVTGNQAMQMVRAGLKAIYLSGWQVAAD